MLGVRGGDALDGRTKVAHAFTRHEKGPIENRDALLIRPFGPDRPLSELHRMFTQLPGDSLAQRLEPGVQILADAGSDASLLQIASAG